MGTSPSSISTATTGPASTARTSRMAAVRSRAGMDSRSAPRRSSFMRRGSRRRRLREPLRLSYAVGRMGSELFVVWPARVPAEAAAELTGWLEDLSDGIPSAPAALASWPDDGDDGASLLALARKPAASQLHGS